MCDMSNANNFILTLDDLSLSNTNNFVEIGGLQVWIPPNDRPDTWQRGYFYNGINVNDGPFTRAPGKKPKQ